MNAKKRMLQYLDTKNISQYNFSKETGLSNGFLKSGSSISSENMELISNIYGDLDLLWLITGKGSMLKNKKGQPTDTIENKKSENIESDIDLANLHTASKGELIDMIRQLIGVNNRNSISLEKMVDTADRNSITLSRLVDVLYNDDKRGTHNMESNVG